MKFSSLISAVSAVLVLLDPVVGQGVDAWHMDYSWTLVREALDPIISPNAVATHMHRIIGGSNFGASYNYDTYESSACSSVAIQADKSAYWMPQLYFVDRRRSPPQFIPADTNIRFYYFLPRNDDDAPVNAFPKGLRMLVGDPNSKTADTTNRFQFSCHTAQDFTNSIIGPDFNFDHTCPFGVKTEVRFPNCWDGVNLWKSDGSHMSYPYAYPAEIRNGLCPLSHPIRIPSILLEYTHFVARAAAGASVKGNLAWANGDTTGHGIHADFVNGWDMDVLTRALNSSACTSLGGSIAMTDCEVFKPYVNLAAAQACKPALGVMQTPCTNNDNADYVPLNSLPGCNPLWASGPKPTCGTTQIPDVTPFKGVNGPLVVPAAEQRGFEIPTAPGWQRLACIKDDDKQPPFTAWTSFLDSAMTVEKCQQSCMRGGYDLAGLELRGGNMCKCAKRENLNMKAGQIYSTCDSACPGNMTQKACGGAYALNTYYLTPGSLNNYTTDYYKGCYSPTDGAAGINAATTYKFDAGTMTPDVCRDACLAKGTKWSALRYGRTCMCGNDFNFGTGSYVPDAQCNTLCPGDSTLTCGALYQYAVYNLTNTDVKAANNSKPAGWQGCYVRGDGKLALQGNSWRPTEPLTVDNCLNGCSELNFNYAGLDSGNTCSCGNDFFGGQDLPTSQCALPCPGSANQTCGGANGNIELYNTTAAKVTFATQVAAHQTGWSGCFADSNSIPALDKYYYISGAMTVATCKTACAGFSYTFAGVTNGNGCRCGSVKPTTRQMPAAWCSSACGGNSSETCGSSGYLEAFDLSAMVRTNYTATLPNGQVGCFAEASNGNGLADFSFTNTAMTHQRCTVGCKELGYKLAGVENGVKCDCGNIWQGGQLLPLSSCNTPCGGNSSQTCGGNNALNVFNTTDVVVTPPRNVNSTGWIGCYMDQASPRILPDYTYSHGAMTPTLCRQACSNRNFTYAGTQNGNQCWCSKTFAADKNIMPSSQCSAPCAGDAKDHCGGSWRVDVYEVAGVASPSNGVEDYLGCFSDFLKVNAYTYQSSVMSADMCKKQCKARGYNLAGTDGGRTCRCGDDAPGTLVPTASCSTKCVGLTTNETCGGNGVGSIYSTKSISANAINENLAGRDGYVGCTTDAKGTFVLTKNFRWNPPGGNSKDTCLAGCAQLGYPMAAMSNTVECTCGTLPDWLNGVAYASDADCNAACPANPSQMCGGGARNSIWSIATSGVANATSSVPGYQGCYQTGNFTTNAPYTTGRDDTMSGSLCQRTCRNKGFAYAGVNNGDTCFCGNSPTMGQQFPLSSCTNACKGDSSQSCGYISTYISMYTTSSPAASPPTSGVPAGYVGCFSDPSNAKQMTGFKQIGASAMSAAICGDMCKSRGFALAGTENSNQCYCGNDLPATLLIDNKCASACTGTPGQTCGGVDRLSVYNVTSVKVATTSSAGTTSVTATRASSTVISGTTRPVSTAATLTTKAATAGVTGSATATRLSSSAATGTGVKTTLTGTGTGVRTSSTGTAVKTTASGTLTGSRAATGIMTLSARATGSSTKAPLPTGNFVVVDGSSCEANDIGTRSYVPEEEGLAVDEYLDRGAKSAARRLHHKEKDGSFVKKRSSSAGRFRKVYRPQR